MQDIEILLIKIHNIIGSLYRIQNRKTNKLVIYAKGAPSLPDDGDMSSAEIILENGFDIFVPDYIGFGRSEGSFTPKNCIKTLLDSYTFLSNGYTAKSFYTKSQEKLKYDDIHFIGSSFGGAYVPLLPRFNNNITNICLIFPMLDWSHIGKSGVPEETVEEFYEAMNEFGYNHLYRGINTPIWKKHFAGKDDLNPIDNIKYLQNAQIFIGHGTKDESIYYKNSESYLKKLKNIFPQNNTMLQLYPFGHDKETSVRSIKDYCKFIKTR